MTTSTTRKRNFKSSLPAEGERSDVMKTFVASLKKDDPKVHVDISGKLASATVSDLPQQCWPRSAATDDLATEIQKLKKKGVNHPFVYCELKKFLPDWASNGSQEQEVSADDAPSADAVYIGKALGASQPKSKQLTFCQWSLA